MGNVTKVSVKGPGGGKKGQEKSGKKNLKKTTLGRRRCGRGNQKSAELQKKTGQGDDRVSQKKVPEGARTGEKKQQKRRAE